MWSLVVEGLLWPITRYIRTCEKFTKNVKWQCSMEEALLLNYRLVIWIVASNVQRYEWRSTSLYRWLEKVNNLSLARKRLLRNFLLASKHPHNSLSSCCCSFEKKNVLKELDAKLNELRHAVHFKIVIVLFLVSGSVSNSWWALCLRLQQDGRTLSSLITRVQYGADICNIVRTNWRAWLNTLDLGTNGR